MAEELAKEVVIAIPLPLRVERNEEEIRGLELPQNPSRVMPLGNRIAERGAEAIEDGGLE
jgi:hypothetical protein